MPSEEKTTVANSNLEPIPAKLKIKRNCYGRFYLLSIEGGFMWDRDDGPVYIRADLYEAALDNAMKRELELSRKLAELEAKLKGLDHA